MSNCELTHKSINELLKIQMRFHGSCLSYFLTVTVLLNVYQCRDVLPQKEVYLPDYSIYHNLSRINAHIKYIASNHVDYVRTNWKYLSKEGRSQPLLHITNFSMQHKEEKVKILLSYGEHARELLPVESMFHLLENITSSLLLGPNKSAGRFVWWLLSKIELYIIAMVNPDGRNYIERKGNYCWRGTSTGVDLNRNFDWNYGAKGSSNDPRDEEYRGMYAFSEPECRILTETTRKYKFDAFVSFHSGIRQIYVPYADTASKQLSLSPDNIEGMVDLAKTLSTSVTGGFSYGRAHQLNDYTADGTIFDYMAGNRKIPFSLAVELWGKGDEKRSKCFDLFNPPSEDLKQVSADLHPFYEELFIYLINWKSQRLKAKPDVQSLRRPPVQVKYYMLALVVMIIVIFVIQFNKLRSPCFRFYQKRRIVSLRSLSSTFSFTSFMKTS